jgi:hypothetical protein
LAVLGLESCPDLVCIHAILLARFAACPIVVRGGLHGR